jgi:periplasmic protein CpxP/Spy
MDMFSQKKFMIWTIALLVLLNVLSLTALWYQRIEQPLQPERQGDQRQESVTQFLNRELQLSDSQKVEFERLRKEYVENSTTLNQEMRESKTALFDLVGASSPDKATIGKLTKDIGEKQAALDLLLFNHFAALRNICTPSQQEKFKTLLRDIRELMRPQNRPGERPPRQRENGQEPRRQQTEQQKRPRPQNEQEKPPRRGDRRNDERPRPRQEQ